MTETPLERCTSHLASTTLGEVSQLPSLMHRYDRKYVTNNARAENFVASLGDEWRVLDIGERRSRRYQSVYLDDEVRSTYRHHVQRRRLRFKVRVRTYEDDTSFLEVKLKTGRGETNKQRLIREPNAPCVLSELEHAWLGPLVSEFDTRSLRQGLKIDYQRLTLQSSIFAERITIDQSIMVALDGEWTPLLSGGVVIETKSEDHNSVTSHTLASRGIHAVSFSKYCAGLSAIDASVHPRVRSAAERVVIDR